MRFYADLHIHSKYSRATSKNCDLEHLALWAKKKGITVVGTGDFTHHAWLSEIKDKLEPAEPGLFSLRPDLEREADKRLEPALRNRVRFMLTVEVSTIYKKGGRTRKVHHVIFAPDLGSAERFRKSLAKTGNIDSDGRPILGLDSRDLLETALEAGEGAYLVPAHVWTPWFSVLGSKSGFDSIEECYGDLSEHIFAVETGLSSDPPMNWRLSSLDSYRLVSNSDAHSPAKLGREANVFETGLDYFCMRDALRGKGGFLGTIEFFPEEGKYHMDGHRKCRARLEPKDTRERGGLCPVCKKPVTVGVMHRVVELADRGEGARPETADPFRSLIPLTEVISEILGAGPGTKGVARSYESIIKGVGPELFVLELAPVEELRKAGSIELAEAIKRMRAGKVTRRAGYDGEYGVIKLFEEGELEKGGSSAGLLFELPDEEKVEIEIGVEDGEGPSVEELLAAEKKGAVIRERPKPSTSIKQELDPDQRTAVDNVQGPLLIKAGPGTGKTRTLTHRIANLVKNHGVPPEQCLAITFTRRAAAQMKERLEALLPDSGDRVPVMTFHALGLQILQENYRDTGLAKRFRVMGREEAERLLGEAVDASPRKAKQMLSEISLLKRRGRAPEPGAGTEAGFNAYQQELSKRGLVDFDDLVGLPVELLSGHPGMVERYRSRWPYVSVDEYQDVDEQQYRLLRLLAPGHANICAIGDPDQAIYGFRGADPGFFLRFQEDYPSARVVILKTNYRSASSIVDGSSQVMSSHSLAGESGLAALLDDPQKITIHEATTDKAEAEFVVHSIERMLGGHTFFSMDSGRTEGEGEGFSFSDFAVLYRAESLAGPLTEALQRSGIPFQMRNHQPLAGRPMVREILDSMQKAASKAGPAEKIRDAVERLAMPRPEKSEEEERGEYVALNQAFDLLCPLAGRCGADLERFFAEVALSVEVDQWDPRAERVSLLSLHAAKGLEFRVVFIVGCEDGVLPLRWSAGSDDLPEERRVFYVGMTRARERLILSHAAKRLWRGKVRPMQPSPFLRDIEEKLIERGKSKARGKKRKPDAEQMDLF